MLPAGTDITCTIYTVNSAVTCSLICCYSCLTNCSISSHLCPSCRDFLQSPAEDWLNTSDRLCPEPVICAKLAYEWFWIQPVESKTELFRKLANFINPPALCSASHGGPTMEESCFNSMDHGGRPVLKGYYKVRNIFHISWSFSKTL